MVHFPRQVEYSDKYNDGVFEYKHVALTKAAFDKMPKDRLLDEYEWRALGVSQTRGWMHYATYKPEPNILLFKRPIGADPKTGEISSEIMFKVAQYYKKRKEATGSN